jgi:hypothetical protein
MTNAVVVSLCVLAALLLPLIGSAQATNPVPDDDDVIIIAMDPQKPVTKQNAWQKQFDVKTVRLNPAKNDELLHLEELAGNEVPFKESANCFLPSLKLVYKDYTYVISTYCASVVKYKNSAPFVPSAQIIPNDLSLTESVIDELENNQVQHLKTNLIANFKYCATKYPQERVLQNGKSLSKEEEEEEELLTKNTADEDLDSNEEPIDLNPVPDDDFFDANFEVEDDPLDSSSDFEEDFDF